MLTEHSLFSLKRQRGRHPLARGSARLGSSIVFICYGSKGPVMGRQSITVFGGGHEPVGGAEQKRDWGLGGDSDP